MKTIFSMAQTTVGIPKTIDLGTKNIFAEAKKIFF